MAKKDKAVVSLSDDEKWRVQSDLETLMRAKGIQKDEKRMAKVRALAKEKLEEVAAVMGDAGK